MINNWLSQKPWCLLYWIGSKPSHLMVRGSFGTCQKIQTGWSHPFPSQEVLLGWLTQKVVGTPSAVHLKVVQNACKTTLWKYKLFIFFKTLLAVVLPRNRIFLIQTKIITILIPSRASSQLVPYLPPQLSWKNWKDVKKRLFFFFNLNSFFLLNFLFCIVLAN